LEPDCKFGSQSKYRTGLLRSRAKQYDAQAKKENKNEARRNRMNCCALSLTATGADATSFGAAASNMTTSVGAAETIFGNTNIPHVFGQVKYL
jgi:hypothetical protein